MNAFIAAIRGEAWRDLAPEASQKATHALLARSASPQFFASIVSASAMIKLIPACLVTQGGKQAVRNIERHYQLRERNRVYGG